MPCLAIFVKGCRLFIRFIYSCAMDVSCPSPVAEAPLVRAEDADEALQLSGRIRLLLLCAATLATFFTNLEAIPLCTVAAPVCLLIIVETTPRIALFVGALVPIGLAMGASTYGYLYYASLLIGLLLQIPLSLPYLCHRVLVRRHPNSAIVSLAFPCVYTLISVAVMYLTPLGSTANPSYSITSFTLLLQSAAIFGRNGLTFLLSWTAACGARLYVSNTPISRRVARVCAVMWAFILLFGAMRYYSPHFFKDIDTWDGAVAQDDYRMSCLSDIDDTYAWTSYRLSVGDDVIIHSERGTSPVMNGDRVLSYSKLLQSNYERHGIEAIVVLSFEQEDLSWYHLVNRFGSQMSYAKNHPVPFVETDIDGGAAPPSSVKVSVGRTRGQSGAIPSVLVTGTVCFDTDFPLLTRQVGPADLLLETSETWFDIGDEHFRGHFLTAIENGLTLVKCTNNGVTGAIDSRGNVLFQSPQTSGVISFTVPRFRRAFALPQGGTVIDCVICVTALIWLAIVAFPTLGKRCLK
eukprot:TRINITY_DN64902_c0_g1_i1.p1 TRINITY_DN64902_c0_g1~~TRINITY_DN64902_c0_g1_i1.p1  ORF type:complete len:520 (+),score=17.97 TRINITY_DN64902_c0_g1_i1:86-1645(+)